MAKKKSVRKKAAPKKSKAKKTSGKTTRKKTVAKKKPAKKSAAKKSVKTVPRIGSLVATTSTLTFLTESLPAFTVNFWQKTAILATGGTPQYSFRITDGTLPEGLTFNSSGSLWGTPAESGTWTIFVKLSDSLGAALTQAFELYVEDA